MTYKDPLPMLIRKGREREPGMWRKGREGKYIVGKVSTLKKSFSLFPICIPMDPIPWQQLFSQGSLSKV